MLTKMAGPAHFCTLNHKHSLDLAKPLPKWLITVSTVRVLEATLLRQDLLRTPKGGFHMPLWLLARMERDIFLWRNKFSLSDADYFEFWIDPVRLAIKRLKSLTKSKTLSPEYIDSTRLERHYLKSVVKGILPKLDSLQTLLVQLSVEENPQRINAWLKI